MDISDKLKKARIFDQRCNPSSLDIIFVIFIILIFFSVANNKQ